MSCDLSQTDEIKIYINYLWKEDSAKVEAITAVIQFL